jgi:hypothetical protein
MEYLKAIYERYHGAAKAVRGGILDEFCKVCGYNRLQTHAWSPNSHAARDSSGRKP